MPISEILKKLGFSTHRIFTEYSKVLKASHQKQFQTRSKDIIHDKTEHQK